MTVTLKLMTVTRGKRLLDLKVGDCHRGDEEQNSDDCHRGDEGRLFVAWEISIGTLMIFFSCLLRFYRNMKEIQGMNLQVGKNTINLHWFPFMKN